MHIITMSLMVVIALGTHINCNSVCYDNGYPRITDYELNITEYTISGIGVDDPLSETSLDMIDALTDELEDCLGIDIDRGCFAVKVAPDWYTSECSGQQLFPCDNDDSECYAKDLTDEDLDLCPCNCRARIQGDMIVVTPDLLLYKAELARMVTGVNNPWPMFGHCLR